MLRHDDNSEATASPSPAAQVRVTPQELAEALARLEARQSESEGTIRLGDAVQELGLSATPEELLREIEAGRAQHQARHQAIPPRTRFGKAGRTTAAALTSGLLLLGGFFTLRSETPAPPAAVAVSAPEALPAGPITIPSHLLVRQPDHKMVLLSEVADGQPVFCDLAATDAGAKLADFAPGDGHWTLIKHGGKVYVRGWIGDMSDTALRSTIVTFHPLAYYVASGLHPVPVTLPLDGFQSPAGLTSDNMISASHVVPDGYLKEKW